MGLTTSSAKVHRGHDVHHPAAAAAGAAFSSDEFIGKAAWLIQHCGVRFLAGVFSNGKALEQLCKAAGGMCREPGHCHLDVAGDRANVGPAMAKQPVARSVVRSAVADVAARLGPRARGGSPVGCALARWMRRWRCAR